MYTYQLENTDRNVFGNRSIAVGQLVMIVTAFCAAKTPTPVREPRIDQRLQYQMLPVGRDLLLRLVQITILTTH